MAIRNEAASPYMRGERLLALATISILLTAIYPETSAASPASDQRQQSASRESETAAGAVKAFHAALQRGDTISALKLMSEDAIIFESGGVEQNRAEYEAHHLKADAAFSAGTIRTPVSQVVITEGNLSTVISVENVTGTFRGRPVNIRSVETMVVRKMENQWRIIHIHWSSTDIKTR